MNERRTVWKVFLVWDFEKEEQWLNEMALEGWALVAVGLCRYTFERCRPGQYIIRLEMHGVDDGYIRFMEQTGAVYIGRMIQWIYFRRSAELGPFDIFSDVDSKITHLQRIGWSLSMIGFANLLIGCVNTFSVSRAGILNLLCATLLMYALGRIHGKKESLQRERLLHD